MKLELNLLYYRTKIGDYIYFAHHLQHQDKIIDQLARWGRDHPKYKPFLKGYTYKYLKLRDHFSSALAQ